MEHPQFTCETLQLLATEMMVSPPIPIPDLWMEARVAERSCHLQGIVEMQLPQDGQGIPPMADTFAIEHLGVEAIPIVGHQE